VLIALGFFRDYFLSQYNNYLYQLYYHDLDYTLADNYSFLKKYSYMELYHAKFFIIALFTLSYFFISLFIIKVIFKEKIYLKICFFFYLTILGIALIFYLYGLMIGGSEKIYEIARTFLSLLQSPLIVMILIPAFKLSIQHKKTE
jgi:hypothetical protein